MKICIILTILNLRRFKAFATFKVPAAISFRLKINPKTGKLFLSNIKVFGIKARSFKPK